LSAVNQIKTDIKAIIPIDMDNIAWLLSNILEKIRYIPPNRKMTKNGRVISEGGVNL